MLHEILIAFAFVLAVLAALNIKTARMSFVWAALAFYFLDLVIGGIASVH